MLHDMISYKDLARILIPRSIRNFARNPQKFFYHTFLSWSALFGNKEVPVLPDWTLRCHPVSWPGLMNCALVPELKKELEGFIRYARPGMVLVDIGSHFGFFTLAALHYGGPSAKVIAVDPSPEAKKFFLANIAINKVQDRVRFFEAAVGASSGKILMLSTGAFGEYMYVGSEKRFDAERIDCLTLPDLVGKTSWKPTHLKIDVEGYEDEVISGGFDFLKEHRPILFLELHNRILRNAGKKPEQLLSILQSIGYRFELDGEAALTSQIAEKVICRLVCLPS